MNIFIMVINLKLKKLVPSTLDIDICGIATDTRYIKPGYLFIPLKGTKFTGEEFLFEAINKGAKAIVLDKLVNNLPVPVIYCPNAYKAFKNILKKFYPYTYKDIKLIGVTGTDGKTSTTTIISYLLNSINKSGYMGTNGIFLDDYFESSILTTPLLCKTYEIINLACIKGLKYLAMEASSEGIKNRRIEGLKFDYTIFTNLTHEHLNTHHNMNNYFKSKFKLFKQMKKKSLRIVNADDEYSIYFKDLENTVFFSIYHVSDYQAKNIRYVSGYTLFDLYTKKSILKDIKINRMEEYNIYNVIPAIIIALCEGIKISTLYKLLLNLPVIPGRLEKIKTSSPYNIYVDFAHTPNALKAVLQSIKKQTKNRVIIVCGAAGEKDKSKRPLMGKVACSYADFVVFTSEDPRSENPNDIIKQMISEITSTNYFCITERELAIDYAIKMACAGDSILITGKGRENFFDINGNIYEYSDINYIENNILKRT